MKKKILSLTLAVMLIFSSLVMIPNANNLLLAADLPIVEAGDFILPVDGTVGLAEDLTPQYDGFMLSINGTVGLSADLTPQYIGPTGGKFIAPIDLPAEGSIPVSNREQLAAIGRTPQDTALGADHLQAYHLTGTYHLVNDIDLNDSEWIPIGGDYGRFTGTFDGQGFVISNLRITNEMEYAGLFGYAENATIKNVGLKETYIDINSSTSIFAGGICGSSFAGFSISNCYNTGAVSASSANYYNAYAGGICGYSPSSSSISNCYNTGEVSANTSAGGICGYFPSSSSISNCYNTGAVSASNSVGGICGHSISDSSINNCYNTGDVSASYSNSTYSYTYAGGICGYLQSSSISNCYNTGDISASSDYFYSYSHAGGICGSTTINASISNCYNTGEVSASSDYYVLEGFAYAGGICGYSCSISNCYNTGDVSASSNDSFNSRYPSASYAGGISGSTYGSISNCYNTGDVNVSSSDSYVYVGGICGSSAANSAPSVNNCYNTGDVSASSFSGVAWAGGIYGFFSSGSISNCCNTGDVSASSSDSFAYAGGICGYSYPSSVSNCYNTGDVSASSSDYYSYAGGICGHLYSSSINNCYNTGAVNASFDYSYAGGICGSNSSNSIISNCYWNSESEQTINGIPRENEEKKGVDDGTGPTTPLTTAEMKDIAFVTLLNANKADNLYWFFDYYDQNNGYPIFEYQHTNLTHPVMVNNGGGSGDYAAGAIVTLTAEAAPSGQRFKEWIITPTIPFVEGTDQNYQIVKFIMPAEAVTATATYEDGSSSPGAAITTAATEDTKSQDYITVNAAIAATNPGNQDIEYLINTDGTDYELGNPSAWQAELNFSGISASTTYYVWSRTAAKTGYDAGMPVASTAITTDPPAGTYKSGDINRDGDVNVRDLSILLENYGLSIEDRTNPNADLNSDGDVNVRDLSILLENYGT